MASRSVAGPSPSRISSRRPAARSRIAASKSGEARKRGAVAGGAGEAAGADRLGAARHGDGAAARLADVGQRASARAARGERVGDRARWPRVTAAGRGDAGMADEGARRPTTSADRDRGRPSSPPRGPCRRRRRRGCADRRGCIRSPSAGTRRCRARRCNFPRCCRGRARPRRNRYICRRGPRPGSNQLLAMMPVRAGRAPVRMVEWPGQVSVAACDW